MRTAHPSPVPTVDDATFRVMAEAMPQLVWSTTPDGYHDYFNERWYAYTGMPRPHEPGGERDAPQGWSWKDYLHPDDGEPARRVWERSLATGEPYEVEYRVREAATGAYRWFLGRALPLRDAAGRIVRWFGTCTDIDDARRTENALAVLAEAGVVLGRTLDTDAALAAAARLAVPRLADWCTIDLCDPPADAGQEPGRLRRVAVEHVEPAKVELARMLGERYPATGDAPNGVRRVVRTGEPELVPEISDAMLGAATRDAEHLALVRALGLRSYVCVPIHDAAGQVTAHGTAAPPARGNGAPRRASPTPDTTPRVIGALTLVAAEGTRTLGPAELAIAEELARRVALALERARVHERTVRDRERLSEQAEELTVQNEMLQQQAVELEMQAAQLQDQTMELETQTESLRVTADELAQYGAELEQARREAEAGRAQRDALLRLAPAVMAVYSGPDHVITYVNPTWERTLGKPGAVGRPFRDVFPEMAGSGIFELLDRVHDDGEPYADPQLVAPIDRGAAGVEETYWDIVLQPLPAEPGAPRDVLVHGVETTPRVRALREAELARSHAEAVAEELARQAVETELANEALARANAELGAAEERLRLATAAAGVGAWDFDPIHHRLVWDDRCRAAFGMPPGAPASPEDVFLHWLHPDDRARTQAAARAALDPAGTGDYDVEFRTLGPDGVVRWVRATGRAYCGDVTVDGRAERRATRFVGTMLDVTDRKAAEAALRDEAQLVDTLQRVGGALAAQLELDRLIQTVTDEATRLTGAQFGAFFYDRADEPGEPGEPYMPYALAGVSRDAFARFPMPRDALVVGPTFGGGGVVRSDDLTKDPRYGQLAPCHGMPEEPLPVTSYLAVPVVSRTGAVVGGLLFGHAEPCRFTTRHERLAEGIAAWAGVAFDNARLYAAEHHARGEAEAARAEAEAANRAKSQFLATMSHELRTPLNAIAGYSELLLMGVRGSLSDEQREDVSRIKRSGQHLLSLINDILNFARLEAGQVEYRLADAPLAPLLSGLEELVGPQVAAKGLSYACDVCDRAVRVRVDAEKVRQVLLNLLSNAVKFTAPGGRVELSCAVEAARVHVRVRDTGRGIPAEQMARIFDPFVQVDRELTPSSQQGIGLGLAISRDLARGMGGDLAAESEVGEGSTFTLTLPRV